MIYKPFLAPDSDYKYTIFYCKNKFISLKINKSPAYWLGGDFEFTLLLN